MPGKRFVSDGTAVTAWSSGRAQIVLPPCDRVPVVCSYALSTDRRSYVGFIQGRLGLFGRVQGSLAIYWPRDIVCWVNVTSFGERTASFRVACEDWIIVDDVKAVRSA